MRTALEILGLAALCASIVVGFGGDDDVALLLAWLAGISLIMKEVV